MQSSVPLHITHRLIKSRNVFQKYLEMTNLKTLLFLVFLVDFSYGSSVAKRGLIGERCLTDSQCRSSQYCSHSFLNPLGECIQGDEEGKRCVMDRYCASKKCSFFKCKKQILVKDGPCKRSADCLDTQYCDDIKGRDLRQCFDRKCTGSCKKDSQCMSDKCHFFTCTRDPKRC